MKNVMDMEAMERMENWIADLKDQHPNYVSVIEGAAEDGMRQELSGQDLGDHILGSLEEAGAEV